MKTTSLFAALLTAFSVCLVGCQKEDHDHDHDDHDHDHEHAEEGHAHDDDEHEHAEEGHAHDDDEHGHEHAEGDHDHAHADGHAHEPNIAGPNGGRVLTGVEPHVEFLVTDDRKVKLTFLSEELKPIAPAEQTATIIAGDRSAPTRLGFAREGDYLISDAALPEGNDFPTVVQLKVTADASPVIEKFNLNLADCPTCDSKEYACTCEH